MYTNTYVKFPLPLYGNNHYKSASANTTQQRQRTLFILLQLEVHVSTKPAVLSNHIIKFL